MFRAVLNVFKAIKCALDEKNRQRRLFRQKQSEIYKEGFTDTKLRDQLIHLVQEMNNDPSVISVKIRIAKEAMPFISGVISTLQCEVTECADPAEFILTPLDSFV